jgi:hypothetical protein
MILNEIHPRGVEYGAWLELHAPAGGRWTLAFGSSQLRGRAQSERLVVA